MPGSGLSLECLRSRARALLQAALAPNSNATYGTSIAVFEKFRGSYRLQQNWPIPIHHIVLFIAFCFEKGKSPKTINTYVAGLNYMHKLNNFYDISHVFIIRKLLTGCLRNRISHDVRAPLTKSILIRICKVLPDVCYSHYESKLFFCLFTVAYFGLFRISELVVPSRTQFRSVVQASDLSVLDNKYILIRLHHFKTNQCGKPVTLKLPSDKSEVCPVLALTEFLALRPKIAGPAFIHSNGSPVTRTQFAMVLAKSIEKAHLPSSAVFKTHSFRIGRATDLASQGLSSSVIMKLGRWSSGCYKLYIR